MPAFKKAKITKTSLKLTQEIIDKVTNTLRLGAYIETAAVMSGVRKETFHGWLKRGAEERQYEKKTIYTALLNAVELAQEECLARDLLVIDRAANPKQNAVLLKDENGNQLYDRNGDPLYIEPMRPDWKAAAWRMARRRPAQWGKVETHEVKNEDGVAKQVVVYVPDNGRPNTPEEDEDSATAGTTD